MAMSLPSRFIGALIALISILFMQLALAGYVCPGLSTSAVAKVVSMSMAPAAEMMVGCDKMDTAQPNLCHAFAHSDHQSLDKPELPDVQPFVPALLTLIFLNVDSLDLAVNTRLDTTLFTHATAPPLIIRHCCFRI